MGNDYTYDVNGNMIKDLNKGITDIIYNHLNLPTRVTIGGKNIDYTYDAGGVKLSKTVSGVATQYAGNYVYENGVLQFFNHPEGYVSPKNASDISQGFKYVYQYKDHLGNVRLSYTDNNNDGVITPSTEIIEESNYYPFGLEHKGYNNNISLLGNSTAQRKAYANKEMQDDLGLNMIDFGARFYDPAIGRWNAIDPLAEEYFNEGTYNYVQNTPIRAMDPNVMEIVIIGSKKYTQKIIDFLSKLGSNSKKGAQLILDAIKSDKQFVIYDPSNEKASNEVDNFSSSEGYETLAFSTNQKSELNAENGRNGKGLVKTPETSLTHELSHFNSPDNSSNRIEGTEGKVGRDEINAVKEENQVRREMGLPERTHYGGLRVYGKKAGSSKYDNRSRLIKDKDYSVNVPGIGKKSFQIIFKYYTNMKYEKLKKYYKGGGTLSGKGHLKNRKQRKQLLINSVK
ncbi:RHS repeat domain-containing protein [Tenacibaculum maritimum]|uniref:RHS repeat domain-containing protein n=1 Tax=Tenacibaculum maritimum TaxID=107401 RepID=UPI0038903BDD